MDWSFQTDRPIYLQLKEQIALKIISGAYIPGQRLPSVREMAAEAAVNPNTLQKALSELERDGLVYANRTSGRFVTEEKEMIKLAKKLLALEQIQSFLKMMENMGYTKEETLALMENLKGDA